MSMKIKWMAAIVTAGLALAGLPLFAQSQPSPGVARVSLVRGNVSMERGDSNEWVAVTVNTPLTPGDTIATAAGSRAEVQLDYSNVVRLDENAEVKIADVNASRIQLQVARGRVDLAVFGGNQANSEVDTPNVAIDPQREGTYRIDVKSDDLSLITVRRGEAQISTPQGSTNLEEGQQITVEGAQNPQYRVTKAPPPDNWDNWNHDRNGVIENAQNYNHINRYYTGAQDLNTYGRWTYVPGYDWCWTPYIDAGWVPYSNGRWVWEPFYGWTWVSYYPWGWAPFHYGRWFFYGSSWFWWPGYVTPYYYPVWGPAWVSFIGFGYGYHRFSFGFGYGFSSIGWCPLGPRDRFHQWWGRGHSFNVININNYSGRGFDRGRGGFRGSNLEAIFSNSHVRRAITTMPADRFGQEAVPRTRRMVNTAMLRNADVVRGTLPVVPTRASLRVTNRAAVVPAVARGGANNTRFFTRHPVSTRNFDHSFNNQTASIRRMVETHDVRASGANRGFQMSRSSGAQGNARLSTAGRPQGQTRTAEMTAQRGNFMRRNPAPVIRENPQARQNSSFINGRGVQANQPAWRRFGSGAPAAQSRGNAGRQNSVPVVRGNQANFRRFGTGSPTVQSRGYPGRQNAAPVVRQSPQSNRSGWYRFTPQAAPQSAPRNQGGFSRFSRAAPQRGNGGPAGWSRFTPRPQAAPQRGGGSYNGGYRVQGNYQPRYQRQPNYGSRYYSRPPLRLNKPIVSEPRYRSYGGSRGGSAPSYHGGSRGSYGGGYHGSPSGSSRGGGGHRR